MPNDTFTPYAREPGVECAFPPGAWVAAHDCNPACTAGARCCKDPTARNATGACYGVDICQQLPGPGVVARGDAWSAASEVAFGV